jgi:MFS family permease
VVLLSFLGWVVVYADRSILSPALPFIHAEWDVDETTLGAIVSVFFVTYALVQIPVGILSDRWRRRLWFLVPGFILFGLSTLASGFAPSPGFLLLASALTGLGQGVYYPTEFALATEVIPHRRRAIATSLINSGQAVGITVGLLFAGAMAPTGGNGWRIPFWVMAIPTIAVGLAFLGGIRRDHDRRRLAPTRSETAPAPTGSMWSLRVVLLHAVNFCSNFGFFSILTWLPFYLGRERGFPAGDTGWISSLVPWAAVVGGVAMSWLADRARNRKVVAIVMLPLCGISLTVIPIESTPVLFGALLLYGLMGKLALDPILAAMLADSVAPRQYGSVFGVFNFSAMLASIIGPFAMGWLASGATGLGMDAGFYAAAGLIWLAFVLVLLMPRANVRRAR